MPRGSGRDSANDSSSGSHLILFVAPAGVSTTTFRTPSAGEAGSDSGSRMTPVKLGAPGRVARSGPGRERQLERLGVAVVQARPGARAPAERVRSKRVRVRAAALVCADPARD